MRCSCRPPCRDAKDLRNGFAIFPVQSRSLRCLLEAAKSWGITVNDLLLALLMRSCALLATGRERVKRAKNISLGCIVNTRRDLAGEIRQTFGLFLGLLRHHPRRPGAGHFEGVGKGHRAHDTDIKRKKLYLAAPLELSFGRLMFSLFSAERQKEALSEALPSVGWPNEHEPQSAMAAARRRRPVDYLRAVSTGPATPLVVSVTTIGEAANIGLSYRSTVFSAGDIERLEGCFLEP